MNYFVFLLGLIVSLNASEPPIFNAVRRKSSTEINACIIKDKLCLNKRDQDGKASLHIAVETGVPGLIATLVNSNARVDVQDCKLRTPLHSAALLGKDDCVNQLLFHKAPVVTLDEKGNTPLSLAYKVGHAKVVSDLLLTEESKVALRLANYEHETPLLRAVEGGWTSVVEILVQEGAPLTERFIDNTTLLYKAVDNKNGELTKWFLNNDHDNVFAEEKKTVVYFVHAQKDWNMMKVLLDCQIVPDDYMKKDWVIDVMAELMKEQEQSQTKPKKRFWFSRKKK